MNHFINVIMCLEASAIVEAVVNERTIRIRKIFRKIFLHILFECRKIICSFAVADRSAEAPVGDEVRREREVVRKFNSFRDFGTYMNSVYPR